MRDDIRKFILDNFMMGREPGELTDTTSMLETGIIDSTGVLELIGFLEERFGIAIVDDDLVPENLDTIENLMGYVERKKQVGVPAK